MDESKPIPMKSIVLSLQNRTESHKIEGKDGVKSSAKTVQFVDEFPSTHSIMKLKVLSPSTTWTSKMGVSTVFIPHSESRFTSEETHEKHWRSH